LLILRVELIRLIKVLKLRIRGLKLQIYGLLLDSTLGLLVLTLLFLLKEHIIINVDARIIERLVRVLKFRFLNLLSFLGVRLLNPSIILRIPFE